ncbi:hypothetical protein [Deinococcus radiophilus]
MTREMKMLLGALMILMMMGALALYFRSLGGAGSEVVTTTETTQSTVTTTDGTTPAVVTSQSTTQSSSIPPLNQGDAPEGTPAAALGGINPEDPLAAVPNRNPFSPFRTVAADGVPASALSSPATSQPVSADSGETVTFAAPSVDLTPVPTYSAPGYSSSYESSGGTAASSAGGTSGSTTVWEFDAGSDPVVITNTPSGNSSTGSSSGSTASRTGGSSTPSTSGGTSGTGLDTWVFDDPADYPEAVPAGTLGSAGGNGTSGSSGPAPAAPPVAGVTAPALNGSVGANVIAQRPATGGTAAGGLSVPLPTPGVPQLITEFGNDQGVGAPDNGTVLSRTLNRQNVRFTGAVLGPTDTAIFRSATGFLVLAEGDRLPDTEITVRDITTGSVTLALGQESLRLELQPIQSQATIPGE